jgi:hypothetical protein
MEGLVEPHACDQATLKLMTERLGSREYLSFSAHDGQPSIHEVKRWKVRIDRFLYDVKAVLLEPSDYSQEAHSFAKACLDLCLEKLDTTPSFGHIYSQMGERSTERLALAKALKTRGIILVQWATAEEEATLDPLGFPHMWAGANDVGPCALLDIGA